MLSNSSARVRGAVGRVVISNDGIVLSAGSMRFFVIVAKPFSQSWKLCTGSPSGVRLRRNLARAAADRLADATGEEGSSPRCSSPNSNGASACRGKVHERPVSTRRAPLDERRCT